SVVEVSWYSDDRFSDGFAEKLFRRGFQALQNNPRQLRRAVIAALHANARVAVWRINDLERRGFAHLRDFGRVELPADQSLDGKYRIGCVRNGLAFRDLAHQSFTFLGETDDCRRR